MKKVIINGLLYNIKDREYAEIGRALYNGSKASGMEHEMGTAYKEFNDLLEEIPKGKRPIFIDNIYEIY
jgi:hypothetical protein